PIDDIGVPGDPPNVRGTEKHLFGLVLEYVRESVSGIYHVSTDGVDNPLGLARRTRGVENEKHIFGVHLLGRARWVSLGFYFFDFVFAPYVPALNHRYGGTGTGDDDYTLHGIALHEGVVNDVFQVNMLRAAVGAVGRDDHLAIGVVDSVCNGLGREATENYRV